MNSVLMRQHHSASKGENRDLHPFQEMREKGASFWRAVCVWFRLGRMGKEKKGIVESRTVRQKSNAYSPELGLEAC